MENAFREIATETLDRWIGHLAGMRSDALAEGLKQDIEQELRWNRNPNRKIADAAARLEAQSGN